MSVQQVVAPGNLGAEFDVGAEEANRIHVRAGRGLWRDGDRLESIPWGPEERWIAEVAEQTLGILPIDLAATALRAGGTHEIVDALGVAGLTVDFETPAGYRYASTHPTGSAVNHSLQFRPPSLNTTTGVLIRFSQPVAISGVAFSGPVDVGSRIVGAGAVWELVSGSGASGLGTDTVTFGAATFVMRSAEPITELLIEGFAVGPLVGRLNVSQMGLILPASSELYTVQRYTDGRILVVADGDMGEIRESLTGMILLDKGPLNNFTATTGPTVADDVSKGYGRGSRWNNGVDEWVCMDGALGAAEWRLAM